MIGHGPVPGALAYDSEWGLVLLHLKPIGGLVFLLGVSHLVTQDSPSIMLSRRQIVILTQAVGFTCGTGPISTETTTFGS